MKDSSTHKIVRLASILPVINWALWLRVIAADLVQWFVEQKRKGEEICVFPDAEYYWQLAGKIGRGESYELVEWGAIPHFALRTPGYPLFLATCQFVFGSRALPVRLVQAVLGAVCVWLVARLARRVIPAELDSPGTVWTIPLIAALLTALSPFVVLNSAFLLSEALFLPLMLLAQYGLGILWAPAAESAPERIGRAYWAILTGVVSALAVLTRPSWALYLPAMLLIWVLCERRNRMRRWKAVQLSALVILGLVVTMSPWWVRNYQILGRFVPTALWMGASLYDGLNPNATGDSDMDFLKDPAYWPLDEEQQDSMLRARAIAFAYEHPRRVLELAVVKAGRFWSPWPNAANFRSPAVILVGALIIIPQFILIAVGAWDRRRDVRCLVLLGFPLTYTFALHLIFVSSMRYRVPVEVPTLVLAAVGLRRLGREG